MLDKKDNIERTKGALYPYDDEKQDECEPQWSNLKAALTDSRIFNIAVTSSYDTGKTSFLKSFFKENHTFKTKFITISNFMDDSADASNLEYDLEKNVINQLLLSENPHKYPDSHIARIYPYSNWIVLSIWALLLIISGVLFSLTSYWNTFWKSEWFRKGLLLFVGSILLWFVIYHLVHIGYKLSWNAKANFGIVELGTGVKDSASEENNNLFVLYDDEIKYYFKQSKIRVVIFEDMDRFQNIEIFQRLRALNKSINDSQWIEKNERVRFIYTLSDAIFQRNEVDLDEKTSLIDENKAAKDKAKFFDYIISMVPFNNLNSSKKIFKEEIKKYDKKNDDTTVIGEISDISLFIRDKREIICIVADMNTYLETLIHVKSLNEVSNEQMDKLFAAMVYKNVYSRDFDNLTKGKSNLGHFLKRKDNIARAIDGQISRMNNADNVDNVFPNPDSLKKYQDKDSISNLLALIFDNYDSIENEIDLEEQDKKALRFIKNTNILRYLLLNNLIEKDFYEYISPTQYDELSDLSQINFIRNVIEQRLVEINSPIEDDKDSLKIIKFLSNSNANFKYAYSSSLLTNCIKIGEEEKAYQILKEVCMLAKKTNAKVENQISFIEQVVSNLEQVNNKGKLENSKFVLLARGIFTWWPDYFVEIFKQKNYELEINYILKCLIIEKNNNLSSLEDSGDLISFLLRRKMIDKYIEEIDNSHEISEEQKKGLKKSIKEKEEIDLSFGQILP